MAKTRWKCTYLSGGGTEYLEWGFTEKSRTDKYITLEMAEVGSFANYSEMKVRKLSLPGVKGVDGPSEWLDEATVVVYHFQAGIPYTYEQESSS